MMCERCQGNGEIVVDWETYLHPPNLAAEEKSVQECPDCNGEGTVADTSPVRCQVCGGPADLTCGPSRFGDETRACKDCWEPDSSRIREAGK